MKRKRIVVLGYMGLCPLAGLLWQHLHYVVGLQRLGHEVFYLEDTARYPYNPLTRMVQADYRHAAETLRSIAARFGFADRWGFRARYLPERPTAGLSADRIDQLYREADAVLNVCASHELHEDLLRSDNLVLVESDPVFVQAKVDQDDAATIADLRRYRKLFTFGESIGSERFPIPLHGFEWQPTRQPVVTDLWANEQFLLPDRAAFTTVTNWSASATVQWRGKPYLWSKATEFMNFVDAPALTGDRFELATDIPEPATEALFRRQGWGLRPPDTLNLDLDAYRRYVQRSKGEFTATKQIVVALNTGWFSDRSACYLAAGRPVITQETGFSALYGTGEGLFGYSSMEELAEAVARINADYPAHCAAARALGTEVFEAASVLGSLLERAGV